MDREAETNRLSFEDIQARLAKTSTTLLDMKAHNIQARRRFRAAATLLAVSIAINGLYAWGYYFG